MGSTLPAGSAGFPLGNAPTRSDGCRDRVALLRAELQPLAGRSPPASSEARQAAPARPSEPRRNCYSWRVQAEQVWAKNERQ